MTQHLLSPRRRAINQSAVRLLGLDTASPAPLTQLDAARFVGPLSCDSDEQRRFLQRIYANSGVQRRGSVFVDENDPEHQRLREFYRLRHSSQDLGPTTAERMAVYAQYAPRLAERASTSALSAAHLKADTITHLITVSCTGFFSPGVDVQLIGRLGLRDSVQRVNVGFMGCHGAFNALTAACAIARANPAARVLVCCVELCSLHMAYGFDPQRLIANALFADGSAAAVIGTDPKATDAPALLATATRLIPDSADAMTWKIGDHGFEMTLSPQVPRLIGQHLRPWVEPWLADMEMEINDLSSLAIHPGGPKVLTAVAEALTLPAEFATPSRQILAEHGNMSSATVLFVLQRLLAAGVGGKCLALGFGPGLTAEGLLLQL